METNQIKKKDRDILKIKKSRQLIHYELAAFLYPFSILFSEVESETYLNTELG